MLFDYENTTTKLKKFQSRIYILLITIIVIFSTLLTVIIMYAVSNVMSKKVSSLMAADCRQIQLNVDNYMNGFINAERLLFLDDNIYMFDATDEKNDDYEISVKKTYIEGKISELGINQNFSDFAILYSDGRTFGWISNITSGLFNDQKEMFDYFSDNNRLEDNRWIFGTKGNDSRVYYVKRLNQNAIIIESFFCRELSNMFECSDQLKSMVVRLVDNNGTIAYMNEGNEGSEKIGEMLSEDISSRLDGKTNISTYDNKYFICVYSCDNGWRIVCSIDSTNILSELKSLIISIVVITVILIVIMLLVSKKIQKNLSQPVSGMVSSLEHKATFDQLSGVLNRTSFVEQVNDTVAKCSDKDVIIFGMSDVDNFKKINDMLGHDRGDSVISRMGNLLSKKLGSRYLVGRMGGDEFAFFSVFENMDKEKADKQMKNDTESIRKAFVSEFLEEHSKCNCTLSGGVFTSVYDKSLNFDSMYKNADEALYNSKNSGKNKFTEYKDL